eukprot:167467_1
MVNSDISRQGIRFASIITGDIRITYYSLLAFITFFAVILFVSDFYILPNSSTTELIYEAPRPVKLRPAVDLNLTHENVIDLTEPSFTECQDEHSGIKWFNKIFNSNWVYLCTPSSDYTQQNIDIAIQNGWSVMQCSMTNHQFQSCLMYNVYLHYINATGFTQFELRCKSTSSSFANHVFNKSLRIRYSEKPLPKQPKEWQAMGDNAPNRRNLDITLMDEHNVHNTTYVNSFSTTNMYNDYHWYYSNDGGDWCWDFVHDENLGLGNPWHTTAFLTQIFGTKIISHYNYDQGSVRISAIQNKSLYIIGKNGLFWKTSTGDTFLNALLRPLFTKYIFKKRLPNEEDMKAPVKRYLIKQIQIVAHAKESLIWNYHENHLKCPPPDTQSPLMYAFRQYYLDRVNVNEAEAILELSSSFHFDIYYNHSLLTDKYKLISLINSNVDDFILVSNRKVNATFCRKRCIVNHKEWISTIVKQFSGLILYGNCIHLSFSTQFFLYTKINMYFGVQGAGFAFTLFMEPNRQSDNKTHFIFEIVPTSKLKRTAKHFAAYAGLCYAYQNVRSTKPQDRKLYVKVKRAMQRIKETINECNGKYRNRDESDSDQASQITHKTLCVVHFLMMKTLLDLLFR